MLCPALPSHAALNFDEWGFTTSLWYEPEEAVVS